MNSGMHRCTVSQRARTDMHRSTRARTFESTRAKVELPAFAGSVELGWQLAHAQVTEHELRAAEQGWKRVGQRAHDTAFFYRAM